MTPSEFLNLRVTPETAAWLKDETGFQAVVGETLMDAMRRRALELSEGSEAWAELCLRYGFTGGGGGD